MPTFTAQCVSRTYTQHLLARPPAVFPLLCPVREAEWLPGWQAELVYSLSGYAEEGCLFKTRAPGEAETIWLISRYDCDRWRLEFVRMTPRFNVGHLHIRLADNGDETTRATITYTFTALSEAGNVFVEGFTEAYYLQKMLAWETALNHFLLTGEKLDSDGNHGSAFHAQK